MTYNAFAGTLNLAQSVNHWESFANISLVALLQRAVCHYLLCVAACCWWD